MHNSILIKLEFIQHCMTAFFSFANTSFLKYFLWSSINHNYINIIIVLTF